MVRGDWIKPGAVVVDMGTNSVPVSAHIFYVFSEPSLSRIV